MKIRTIINFVSIFFVLLFSLKINAELIFKEDFPKNIQGIWSEDCDQENQVFIISNNTSMWIDSTYVGFNISKTANKLI